MGAKGTHRGVFVVELLSYAFECQPGYKIDNEGNTPYEKEE